jgi:anti-anti-sigma regulatory factor
LIVALALVGLAAAAEKDGEAVLVDGSEKVAEYFTNTGYDYKFKTSNSIIKEEVADLDKNIVTGFVNQV